MTDALHAIVNVTAESATVMCRRTTSYNIESIQGERVTDVVDRRMCDDDGAVQDI